MAGRGVILPAGVGSTIWRPARAARSSTRHASCCCSVNGCCGLPSANVTHFQALHSPGSSLPHCIPPLWLPPPYSLIPLGQFPWLRKQLLSAGGAAGLASWLPL